MTDTNSVDLSKISTIGVIARYHTQDRPDAVAQVFEGRETTYAQLEVYSNQVANALLAEGVGQGDRIGFLGKNSDQYFELFLGGAKIGAVMTPIGWRLAPPEIAYIVENSAPAVLFVAHAFLDSIRPALSALSKPPKIIILGDEGDYEKWRDAAPASAPSIQVRVNDVAVQLYTSGTTGRPKGAMLTHESVLSGWQRGAAARLSWNLWTPDDVSLVAMPVAHIGGTGWGLLGLLCGAKNIIVREFDPLQVLDFVERERISKMFLVPAALQAIVRLPRAREIDYARLKCILYGAAPIALDLLRECIDVFGCGFCQLYGMTETAGAIVYLPPEDHDPAGNPRMRAAGLPMPGVELKIVNDRGETLGTGEIGQVATRSASNMAGYWGLESATAATIDKDGWLLTGDAGYLDEPGYLYIQDRIKDVIISGAENIYPTEVENAIFGHPSVAEVAVIGVPDDRWGEAVKAIVVPKPGAETNADDIIAFARQRIAAFKLPKSIDFVESLPRNAAGKVLRRQLRDPFWAGRERAVN